MKGDAGSSAVHKDMTSPDLHISDHTHTTDSRKCKQEIIRIGVEKNEIENRKTETITKIKS